MWSMYTRHTLPHIATQWHTPQLIEIHHIYIFRYTRCAHMRHTATHCNALQHTATHCNALHLHAMMDVMCATTVQHTVTHYKTLQHTAFSPHSRPKMDVMLAYLNTATNCTTMRKHSKTAKTNKLQNTTAQNIFISRWEYLYIHDNALQNPATPCNTLQHATTKFYDGYDMCVRDTLQPFATHCNTLHHTAVHFSHYIKIFSWM